MDAARLLAHTAATPQEIGDALRSCDPAALASFLRDQRLLALLGARAVAAWGADAPSGFARAVEADLAANRARGLALEGLSARFVASLSEQGIRAIVLKGPPQARRLHGDVGLRLSNDVDLLVSREHLAAAAGVLEGFGYALDRSTPVRTHGLPDLHLTLRGARTGLPRIDLHWRVHWYEERFSAELLGRARKNDAFLEPDPCDDLAALTLFYARDGFLGLRAAVDIAAWREVHRSEPAPVLERHCHDYPRLRRSFAAAALALEQVVGIPAAELVPEPEGAGAAPRLAASLANWSQAGDPDQLRANVAVVDALLSPPGELPRFLRREVFVTRAEIESIYPEAGAARWRIAAMRLAHAAKTTIRQLAGLSSAVRGSRRRPAP